MPRPKGSKNKPKDPVEFNYEEEADQAYASAMNPSMPQVRQMAPVEFDYAEDQGMPSGSGPSTAAPRPMFDSSANIFLINGRVRLDRAGQEPVIAEQQRLVYAHNFNEAVAKYSTYFSSLSNQNERYTVIGAGGSEAIR